MSKPAIIWLIVAAALVVISLILFAVTMFMNEWDFTRINTRKYELNEHSISDSFTNIAIHTDTANIQLVLSDDGSCRVVCHEISKAKHHVSVDDGTLTVRMSDERKWYDHIGIGWGESKITVYLPETAYSSLSIQESTGKVDIPCDFTFESMGIRTSTGDVKNAASVLGEAKIQTSTGDISVEGISVGSLSLTVTTGHVTVSDVNCQGNITVNVSTGRTELSNVSCSDLSSDGSTGDIILKDVIASGKYSLERSTGDIKFEGCDASEIWVQTDTGSITGSFLSDKIFFAQSDTGRVNVPKTLSGGKCEITTDTGNIKITVNES